MSTCDAVLAALEPIEIPIDTAKWADRQPQGYVRDWSLHATELWDVRHLRGWPQVPRYVKEPNRFAFVHRVRRNDGSACKPYEVGCRPGRRIVPYSKIVAPRFSWTPRYAGGPTNSPWYFIT